MDPAIHWDPAIYSWNMDPAAGQAQVSALALLLKEMLALGQFLILSNCHFEVASHWGKVVYVEFLTH